MDCNAAAADDDGRRQPRLPSATTLFVYNVEHEYVCVCWMFVSTSNTYQHFNWTFGLNRPHVFLCCRRNEHFICTYIAYRAWCSCVYSVDVVYNLQSYSECCIRGASSGSCHLDEERRCRFYLIMHLSVFDVIFFVIHVCWRCCCQVAVPSSSSLFIQFQFNYFEYYIWKFLPFFSLSTRCYLIFFSPRRNHLDIYQFRRFFLRLRQIQLWLGF